MCGCIWSQSLRGYEQVCSFHAYSGRKVASSVPRYTVANPPRVYQIAKMHGVTSKVVLSWLDVMGQPAKSSASRVPLRVWHNLYSFTREYMNF